MVIVFPKNLCLKRGAGGFAEGNRIVGGIRFRDDLHRVRGNFLCHRELPGQGKNIHPVRIGFRALVGLQRHRIGAVEIRGWCDFVVADGEVSALCVQIDLQMDWCLRGAVLQFELERGFPRLCACRDVIIAVYGLVDLLHVGVHRERCLAVGVVGGQCGGSVTHQDALQINVGNRVAWIE